MPKREPRTVRVDPEVWSAFTDQVIEWEGQKRGELGRHVESALSEYIDNDRSARIEEKLDRVIDTLDSDSGTRTHNVSEGVKTIRAIYKRIERNHGKVVKNLDVKRAIQDYTGIDERTVNKHKKALRERGLLFEHPGDSSVWTTERDEFVKWCEAKVNTEPETTITDLIDAYPIDVQEYDQTAEKLKQ